MIVTVSGYPGAGKTSVLKLLSERLGYRRYSMGDLRGMMALERGITIDELNRLGETDPTTDTQVDEYAKRLGETEDDFIIDGRVSWFFIPRSFKVFLDCDPAEAGRRIYEAKRAARGPGREDEPAYASPEAAAEEIRKRVASDALRYRTHYGIEDWRDPAHFDLVIDTTRHARPEETVERILAALPRQS